MLEGVWWFLLGFLVASLVSGWSGVGLLDEYIQKSATPRKNGYRSFLIKLLKWLYEK